MSSTARDAGGWDIHQPDDPDTASKAEMGPVLHHVERFAKDAKQWVEDKYLKEADEEPVTPKRSRAATIEEE